jgi:hypothetical protein
MPLTISPSGSVQSAPPLWRGDDVEAGAVEREQMRRDCDFDGRTGRRRVFQARKAQAGRGRRGDVKRRQRLDEGLVLLAFVAKRGVGRVEHGDVGDRVGEIAGGRYAGFRAEQADQEVVR